MKHGHLTVIRDLGRDDQGHCKFECLCECGKTAVLRKSHFYESRRYCSRKCALLSNERALDLTGKRFARWTVLEKASGIDRFGRVTWKCICDCGTEKILASACLSSGGSRSCGCYLKDIRSTGRTPEEELQIRRKRSRLSNRKNPARVKANKINYERRQARATPAWLTAEHWSEMNDVYEKARERSRQSGVRFEVDHIVPLKGEQVSGLHVPWNLQILTQVENVSKSNRYAELSGD